VNDRVLFISPRRSSPISNGEPVQKLRTNFSLPAATVLGPLEAEGFEPFFIDAAAEGFEQRQMLGEHRLGYGLLDDAILDQIRDIDPNWILVTSMFTFEQCLVDSLVQAIKAKFPHKTVIVGGIHASVKPEWHLEESVPDYIVIGEGEETIVELLKSLSRGEEDVSHIAGLAYLDGSGNVRKTGMRQRLATLDHPWALNTVFRLPNGHARYLEGLTRKSPVYAPLSLPEDTPTFAFYASRGCPFGCPYCPTLPRDGSGIRHMGANRMFRDFLVARQQHDVGVFYNQADTFGFHAEDRSFLGMLADYRRNSKDTDFVINNPDAFFAHLFFPASKEYQMDVGLVDLISAAGVNIVTLAIETFSPRFNKKIPWQHIRQEQISELCSELHRRGIRTDLYMMYGFPGQTQLEFDRDVQNTQKLLAFADSISWHFSTLLPGTINYDRAVASGRITESRYRRDFQEGYSFFYPIAEYNLSQVPTSHFQTVIAEFGSAWV